MFQAYYVSLSLLSTKSCMNRDTDDIPFYIHAVRASPTHPSHYWQSVLAQGICGSVVNGMLFVILIRVVATCFEANKIRDCDCAYGAWTIWLHGVGLSYVYGETAAVVQAHTFPPCPENLTTDSFIFLPTKPSGITIKFALHTGQLVLEKRPLETSTLRYNDAVRLNGLMRLKEGKEGFTLMVMVRGLILPVPRVWTTLKYPYISPSTFLSLSPHSCRIVHPLP
ncbi:uncharacterized protein BDR25DRAFT_363306 [Lindgomyces ingoldianus]|uniref:Uncharacterized protein n=1 Tax=Lindgomyces ingoldianus TaxID=673940 RepID=A0ACB6Q7X2_9PLEO|nr:uncharacterized protein BDR25DRAFT_363306 [Lindgomyces ingoldianus]KAF2462979.1 hypothetical protein BDR25DRAFT_363306 [Lindgomyces ingoldianus]